MKTTVGTCSLCGGLVAVPNHWHSNDTPRPSCIRCGATIAQFVVLPMQRQVIEATLQAQG